MTDTSLYTIGTNIYSNTWNLIGRSFLVSSMTEPDGIGGFTATNYRYEGGLVHKYGRGLLGFNKVISEDTATKTKSESLYAYDSIYLQMNLTEAKMYIDNDLVSGVKNSYKATHLNGTPGYFYKEIFYYNDTIKTTDYLTGTIVTKLYNYGSNNSAIITNKGNLLSLTEAYGNEGSVVTNNTYTNANYTVGQSTMSLCKLSGTVVTSSTGSEPSFTKNISYQYNANGLLWKVTDFSNLPGSITTTYTYNGNNFGNVTQKTISTSGLTDRSTTYTYDTKGRFITGETNMLNQTLSYQYNSKFGVKKSVTGINNLTTTYSYDGFGNLTTEHLPNGETNKYSRRWALSSGIPNAIFYTSSEVSNAPDVNTYYDALGRVIYNDVEGFNGSKVITRKEYNAKGQVAKESQPYYAGDNPKWTTYSYDSKNRLDSVNINGLISTYAYSGKTITITDPGGKSSSKTLNSMGQVVSATDNGGTITYTYCSNGQPKTIAAPGSTIENRYDEYGRQTKTIDPDAGTTSYVYNGFGELYSQTDTNGNTYTMTYDNAGRLTQKTGPEGNYVYTYVPNNNPGTGLVQNITSPGDTVVYTYNDYGLPVTVTNTINGKEYAFSYEYNNLNNNTLITYPSGLKVIRDYDNHGRLVQVSNDDIGTIWKLNDENAMGQATETAQGNNLNTYYSYDPNNYLNQISSTVQEDYYIWNANTGNLTSRTDDLYDLTESFTYDNLDRLTTITQGNNMRTISYQSNGNISTKFDAGAYTYDPVKIHSINRITDNNCTSAIDQALQNITYTPFKKVKTIQQQNDSLIYTYGYVMERRKMQMFEDGQLVKTRIYCGLYEKETLADNAEKEYCYISGGNGITAVLINKEIYYLRRDAQGSITGLVEPSGGLVEEYSYDAWGRRRNPTDWTYDNVPQPQYINRGYTMHEMLDEFGLINMNGRCYDPVVGRFLSPDIVVQNPNNTQCYNRYSYCINNPLKYSDPSGWRYDTGWLRWHQPSDFGSRRHAIDLILSKIWTFNEEKELFGLLELAGGNSLNNAGEPIDFLDQQAGAFKLAIGNMEKRPELTWSTVTTKYDDGTEFTKITYFYNNAIIGSGTISKAIKDNKETLSIYLETADKANTITGFVTYGIGVDAAFEAVNFSYSAGERFGQSIISAKEFTKGGQAFFKSLGSRLEIAGKVGFWAGVFIGATSFAMEPSVKKGIATLLDIGAGAALQWGGCYGAIAAGIYFGVKYGVEYTVGWDNLWDAYEKYPPHTDMFLYPYY